MRRPSHSNDPIQTDLNVPDAITYRSSICNMASLLSLPPEVRVQIFQYAVPNDGTFVRFGPHSIEYYLSVLCGNAQEPFRQPHWRLLGPKTLRPVPCSWVFACRAFFEEATPLLYRSLRFDFSGMTPTYLTLGFASLSARYRDMVQHVSIGKFWLIPPSPLIAGLGRGRLYTEEWSKICPSDDDLRAGVHEKIGLADSVNFLLDHFPDLVNLDIESAICGLSVGDHNRRSDLVGYAVQTLKTAVEQLAHPAQQDKINHRKIKKGVGQLKISKKKAIGFGLDMPGPGVFDRDMQGRTLWEEIFRNFCALPNCTSGPPRDTSRLDSFPVCLVVSGLPDAVRDSVTKIRAQTCTPVDVIWYD